MSDTPQPILCEWVGDAFIPVGPSWAKAADKDYIVHERYRIAPVEVRSKRSHNHYFAAVADAWKNLPKEYTERFPTAEHLRKWCLIKRGWRDERTIVCSSKAEAQRMAAFMKPLDEYAVIVAKEAVVVHWTAKSQSARAMGKQDFQQSKDDVLDELAQMLGTTADDLKKNAKEVA